jgi:hypothetical protein
MTIEMTLVRLYTEVNMYNAGFVRFAGLIASASFLFCPNAMAQSKGERVKELFAARGIEKLAYTVAGMNSFAGWVFEANEITKDHPLPKLLWKFDASEPNYTVDGKKVAFDLGSRGKSTGIYVMDAGTRGGSELWEEHPPIFVTHISWSHDGTKLAFAAEQHKKEQIFVTSSNGSDMLAVAEGSWPSTSMDDKQLVFGRWTESKGKSNSAIWIVNVDGSNSRPVTDNNSLFYYPSWLPNGGGILFASNRDGKFAIYAMDANGENVRLIMRSEKFNLVAPSISPDGRTLVCDKGKDPAIGIWPGNPAFGIWSVWVVPLDGKGEAVLLTSGYHASVVWRGQETREQLSPPPRSTPD